MAVIPLISTNLKSGWKQIKLECPWNRNQTMENKCPRKPSQKWINSRQFLLHYNNLLKLLNINSKWKDQFQGSTIINNHNFLLVNNYILVSCNNFLDNNHNILVNNYTINLLHILVNMQGLTHHNNKYQWKGHKDKVIREVNITLIQIHNILNNNIIKFLLHINSILCKGQITNNNIPNKDMDIIIMHLTMLTNKMFH